MKLTFALILIAFLLSCKKEKIHAPKELIYQCSSQTLTHKGQVYYLYHGYLKQVYADYEVVYLQLDSKQQIIKEVFAKFPVSESKIADIRNDVEDWIGNPQRSKYSTCFLYKN